MAWPLFDLTQADKAWNWGDSKQTTFKALKTVMTTALVLVSLQDTELFQIEVDSLDFATGTVLFQQSAMDSKWRLIVFYSKSLSLVE